MIKVIDPRVIFTTLDQIDTAQPSYRLSRPEALRRVFWVLASVCICLLLINYLRFFSAFQEFLAILSRLQGESPDFWLTQLRVGGFINLLSYTWWAFWHVVGYVLIPVLVIKFILKEDVHSMGWQWGDTHKHWRGYALLATPIFFFIFLVSFRPDFLQHYPFYTQAHRSWFDFLSWEILYLAQFICLEFFFRGYLLNALRPAIGANAIWVMCVPYLMIHFPKPWLEATGAILFGLFLGLLALRSRSIWGGFFVHAGIAVTMDVTALARQDKLPTLWWPF